MRVYDLKASKHGLWMIQCLTVECQISVDVDQISHRSQQRSMILCWWSVISYHRSTYVYLSVASCSAICRSRPLKWNNEL